MSDLIKSRRSIRKYDPEKAVTRKQLDQLLEAAMLAPSAKNNRPWEFIAVTNREMLDKLAVATPYTHMCKTATAAIIVVGAPQDETAELYFPQDCGAATQNILLEAVSMGLGTCWCGVYPVAERVATMRKLFDIHEPRVPFNLIAVGYPDENPPMRGFFEADKVSYID